MTAKEYLGQAYRLDQRINSKIAQVASLNEMATKCTTTLSGMPHSPSGSQHSMADTIDKIVDLQREINRDIDELVDLKVEMVKLIKAVENHEFQTLLEMRYLCFETWEHIAVDLKYSIHHLYKMHNAALEKIDRLLEDGYLET